LVPDLLRGRGRSISGDLDVDEEGSEQNGRNLAITTPQLDWLRTCMHSNHWWTNIRTSLPDDVVVVLMIS
jgi:hypothetical protein